MERITDLIAKYKGKKSPLEIYRASSILDIQRSASDVIEDNRAFRRSGLYPPHIQASVAIYLPKIWHTPELGDDYAGVLTITDRVNSLEVILLNPYLVAVKRLFGNQKTPYGPVLRPTAWTSDVVLTADYYYDDPPSYCLQRLIGAGMNTKAEKQTTTANLQMGVYGVST